MNNFARALSWFAWASSVVWTAQGLAQDPSVATAAAMTPTITVHGHAHIRLPADNAVISATIVNRATQVEKAFELVEKRTQDIAAFLKQSGIADDAFSVQPVSIFRYSPDRRKDPFQSSSRVIEDADESAYQVARKIHVTIADLKKLNTIHLGLIQRGLDRLDHIEYKSSKSKSEFEKLRVAAVKEARTKATAMAGELGAELASIHKMTDLSSPYPNSARTNATNFDDDPFGSGYGTGMGGMGSTADAGLASVLLVAEAEVIFRLGKTELVKP